MGSRPSRRSRRDRDNEQRRLAGPARGLTTSLMPYDARGLEIDFVEHALRVRVTDGQTRSLRLEPMSVADFSTDEHVVADGEPDEDPAGGGESGGDEGGGRPGSNGGDDAGLGLLPGR